MTDKGSAERAEPLDVVDLVLSDVSDVAPTVTDSAIVGIGFILPVVAGPLQNSSSFDPPLNVTKPIPAIMHLNRQHVQELPSRQNNSGEAANSLQPESEQLRSVRQAVSLQLCCGSAGFSASMSTRGFKCVAVDHTRNRFRAKHAVTMLDLERKESVLILCDIIDQGNVTTMLLAPPCGTASRAREIPLTNEQVRQLGGRAPVQLRSEVEPWGLATLTGLDKAKVQAANRIYVNLGIILLYAVVRGVKPLIESPRSSYLWLLWPYSVLIELYGFFDVDFQHCRHGGSRPKWTRLRTLMIELRPMAGLCPGLSETHKHKPWGLTTIEGNVSSFATAEEAEYPRLQCETMADASVLSATAMGFCGLGVQVNQDIRDASAMQLRRMAGSADRSNAGRKPLPLISEFEDVITLPPTAVDAKKHRILRTTVCKGGDGSIESLTVGVFGSRRNLLKKL